MNSEFLKHLQSITPQGKAEEKRMFIPADVIKKEVEDAEELRKLDSIEELDESEQLIPNAPGQPKKAARKLSYALKNNKNVSPAMVRWSKKGVSHMKRVGANLDRELDAFKKSRGISEATRSKYLKIYGKHKVGRNEGDIEKADLAREMAMLRRGGATPEQMKAAAEARGRFRRYEKPDPSYNPHDKAMAKYRFANMA